MKFKIEMEIEISEKDLFEIFEYQDAVLFARMAERKYLKEFLDFGIENNCARSISLLSDDEE